MRRVAAVLIAITASGALAFPTSANAKTSVEVSARIDDQQIVSASKTVRLSTTRPITLDLTMRNTGSTAVTVRALRLEGRVVGVTFFGYSTITRFTIPPGATDRRRIDVDLLDLGDQATGLIPAKLRVLDTRRHIVASRSFVADVRGSARSTYASFTLVLAIATGIVFGVTLLALARNRLSPNRFVRGGLFLLSGLGIGFVLVFAVSVLRIMAPISPRWQPLVLIPAIAFFALGYLTPTPTLADEWDAERQYEMYDAGYDDQEREGEFAG